ncbi:uncharacterized protein METZ01_LOCUS335802, partial [marine metagenome]
LGEITPWLLPGTLLTLLGQTLGGAGGFTSSWIMNNVFGISEVFEKYGIDHTDPEQVIALLENPGAINTVLRDINTYAGTHAITSGMFGIAMGRLMSPLHRVAGKTVAGRTALRVGGGATIGAVSEGGSEGLALIAIERGPEENKQYWQSVLGEASLGPMMSAPVALTASAIDVYQTLKTNRGRKRINDFLKGEGYEIIYDDEGNATIEFIKGGEAEKAADLAAEEAAKRELEEAESKTELEIDFSGGTILGTDQQREEEHPGPSSVSTPVEPEDVAGAKNNFLNSLLQSLGISKEESEAKKAPFLFDVDNEGNAFIAVGDKQIPITERTLLVD